MICGIKTPGKASFNRNNRADEASIVNGRIGALPFPVGCKVTMMKAAGPMMKQIDEN